MRKIARGNSVFNSRRPPRSWASSVAAFRNYAGTFEWSEWMHQRFRGCLKHVGFEFHRGRCSYIARTGEHPARKRALCDELATAGFKIILSDVRDMT